VSIIEKLSRVEGDALMANKKSKRFSFPVVVATPAEKRSDQGFDIYGTVEVNKSKSKSKSKSSDEGRERNRSVWRSEIWDLPMID
jgi:hypothetical protein